MIAKPERQRDRKIGDVLREIRRLKEEIQARHPEEHEDVFQVALIALLAERVGMFAVAEHMGLPTRSGRS